MKLKTRDEVVIDVLTVIQNNCDTEEYVTLDSALGDFMKKLTMFTLALSDHMGFEVDADSVIDGDFDLESTVADVVTYLHGRLTEVVDCHACELSHSFGAGCTLGAVS